MPFDKNICRALLQRQNPRYWWARPPSDEEGIYVITQYHPRQVWYEVLYVGRGQLRNRLNNHFSGNDRQQVGAFLAELTDRAKTNIFVDWEATPNNECVEGKWIDCIVNTLGYRPRFNRKDGDSCD